jgi:hypothetical protein
MHPMLRIVLLGLVAAWLTSLVRLVSTRRARAALPARTVSALRRAA